MNMKLIGAILCIGILSMSAIPVLADGVPYQEAKVVKPLTFTERILKKVPVPTTGANFGICTVGAKKISSITLVSGNETEMGKIQKILNKSAIRSWISLPSMIKVTNLSFTIDYSISVNARSRNAYFTEYGVANFTAEGKFNNLTNPVELKNTAHNLTITNLTGYFIFKKSRLFKVFPMFEKHRLFAPAEIMFVGFCEDILQV